jgi:nucleoside-diphosphate-sugar epimerase
MESVLPSSQTVTSPRDDVPRAIVTGSEGFIGAHLSRHLRSCGYEVLGIDKRADNAHSVRLDILDQDALKRVFAEFSPHYVFHLAAETDLHKVPAEHFSANVDGTRNVLAAILVSNSVRHSVFASTQLVCSLPYRPVHDADYRPAGSYAESKVEMEKLIRAEDGAGKDWTLVRLTTVWGPGMRVHYFRAFRMIKRGLYFHMGRTSGLRSLSYVGNAVVQLERLLHAPPELVNRKTLYIADYEPVSIRQWTDAIARSLHARRIRTLPIAIARLAAISGDVIARAGFRSPFTSTRLRNLTIDATVDLEATRLACGDQRYTLEEGVIALAEDIMKRYR